MGSANHVVVDVSSDDEVDTHGDYLNWLNDLSSDSIEVVSEVKGGVDSQCRKPIISSVQALEDDDDCVILDGDPDKTTKTATVGDDYKLSKDDDDDEVLVVGQKGEIACRDFPHPRHSCAKYSFNSTSHANYCHMCHCYVCDIPAPCPYWGLGISSIDHCHASDKEKIWKNQREYFRTGVMPSQPSAKLATTPPLPASASVTRQILPSPAQTIIRLSQNPLPRNKIEIRPCSSSSRVANLSNVRGRYRNKLLPHSHGLHSLINGRSNVIRKDRSSYMGNRSRVAAPGTRYGAANGNNNKVGPYTNAKVSQSTHHSAPPVVVPTTTPEMYTQQQRNCQLNVPQLSVPDYCAAVTGTQSNVYTQHSGQGNSVSGNCEFQANENLFALPEALITTGAGGLQSQTVEQQTGTNENALQSKLSEVESWLMDSSNQAGLVSPLTEPVGQDNISPLTFDFETFLND